MERKFSLPDQRSALSLRVFFNLNQCCQPEYDVIASMFPFLTFYVSHICNPYPEFIHEESRATTSLFFPIRILFSEYYLINFLEKYWFQTPAFLHYRQNTFVLRNQFYCNICYFIRLISIHLFIIYFSY